METVDCLRGLAAFAVMCYHFTNGEPTILPPSLIRSTGAFGHLGVEVFFVVSGFVLPYALWRALPAGKLCAVHLETRASD